TRPTPPVVEAPATPPPAKVRIGLALGGGAAKGFAHVGVIKMLEANGIEAEVVAGTSAGSVVGAMYASGMGPFEMQRVALGMDESEIRDVRLFSGGMVQGQALQDYVNRLVDKRPLERMPKRFAAVATRLED
ncbi:patatin-like phospholipase family protein, partial [Lysobacter sp. D1-1-M9]|uniref:patatin-like phospholipase family protein n=1 Tax=Novilysobacter longmucuonensis TaxID=3098603 RepID=UPI002FCC40B7